MTSKALSREIKFRVWQNEWKKMYKVRSIHFNDKGDIIGLHYKLTSGRIGAAVCIDTYLEIDSVVLMQYTGLHDKNGKEIYEGDIVKFDNTLMTVEWVDEEAGFTLHQKVYEEYHNVNSRCEIIGNIYENPELLTKENN